MRRHVILWCGPIWETILTRGPELPPDTQVVTVSEGIGGIGSSHFAALGQRYGSAARLLSSRGVELGDATLTIASFSAGHGLTEILLRDASTLDSLRALGAFDSYYVSQGDTRPKPGFKNLVLRAIDGDALAIFTTSGFAGPTYPSATSSFSYLANDVDLRPARAPAGMPTPNAARARGDVLWLDYGTAFKHGEHATKLAPLAFTHLITPYLVALDTPRAVARPSGILPAAFVPRALTTTSGGAELLAAGLALWMLV